MGMDLLFYLVFKYGVIGLGMASFIGSTVFVPFSVEVLFPLFFAAGLSKTQIVLASAGGSTLGLLLNFTLGRAGHVIIRRKVGEKSLRKSKRFMNKYGIMGLFMLLIIPAPIPVDPVTVLVGMTGMNVYRFALISFAARLVRYIISVSVMSAFFS